MSLINNAATVYPYSIQVADCDFSENSFHQSATSVIRGVMMSNKQYLTNTQSLWLSLSETNQNLFPVEIKVLTGGITNVLFLATIKNESTYDSVIIRIYGPGTSKIIDRSTENIVFAKLSSIHLGPTFFGRFLNGRIEGYIEGSMNVSPSSMKSVAIYPLIASAVATFHKVDIEELRDFKQPSGDWLWNKISLFISSAKEVDCKEFPSIRTELEKVEREVLWLKKQLLDISRQAEGGMAFGFDIVLCHNDLLSGNILLCPTDGTSSRGGGNDVGSKAVLIDYEYSMYNYRAFDIANHFCECCGFEFDLNLYPSETERRAFLAAYLRCFAPEGNFSEDFSIGFEKSVTLFSLASHLFWGSWSIYQSLSSGIDFDYKGYAKLRIDAFFKFKEDLKAQFTTD